MLPVGAQPNFTALDQINVEILVSVADSGPQRTEGSEQDQRVPGVLMTCPRNEYQEKVENLKFSTPPSRLPPVGETHLESDTANYYAVAARCNAAASSG